MMTKISYVTEDPWEIFIYKLSEAVKDGIDLKINYGGMEAGVSLDLKAIEKLSELFSKGVPLETAIGIDLPKMLSSIEGDELDITIKTKECELNFKLKGESLQEFRKAMQSNPIDGEVLLMISTYLKKLVE